MTLNAHYTAFVTWLRFGMLADKVDEVTRTTNNGEPVQANYVVVGLDLPSPRDRRYTDTQRASSATNYRFDVRYVAVDRTGVLQLAQASRERLLGVILDVPGRTCEPIGLVEPVEEGRVRWDRTAGLFHADDTFEFRSREAA